MRPDTSTFASKARLTGGLFLAALLGATALLFAAGPALATSTTNVYCAPYGSDDLQSALDNYTTINVYGTCRGNFVVPDSRTVQGASPGATIDGRGTGSALMIQYGMWGVVNLVNLTFTGGHAPSGGGIYIYGAITVNLTNSTVKWNRADYGGGGIYAGGGAQLNMTGSTVTRNSAGAYGGGIYILDARMSSTASTISLNDTMLSGGVAPGNGGGGVYVESGDAAFANTRVTSNKVLGYGGGIALIGGRILCAAVIGGACGTASGKQVSTQDEPLLSELSLTSSSVDHNSAKYGYGGGIYSSSERGDTELTVGGSAVSFNNAFGAEGDADGGGIANYGACGYTATVLVTGSTFKGNGARNGAGGAIFNGTGLPCPEAGTALVTIAQSGVTNARNNLNQNQAEYGGGIANEQDDGLASVSIQAGAQITGNKATVTGGGIWNNCGSLLKTGGNVLLNTPNNIVSGCFV